MCVGGFEIEGERGEPAVCVPSAVTTTQTEISEEMDKDGDENCVYIKSQDIQLGKQEIK